VTDEINRRAVLTAVAAGAMAASCGPRIGSPPVRRRKGVRHDMKAGSRTGAIRRTLIC